MPTLKLILKPFQYWAFGGLCFIVMVFCLLIGAGAGVAFQYFYSEEPLLDLTSASSMYFPIMGAGTVGFFLYGLAFPKQKENSGADEERRKRLHQAFEERWRRLTASLPEKQKAPSLPEEKGEKRKTPEGDATGEWPE